MKYRDLKIFKDKKVIYYNTKERNFTERMYDSENNENIPISHDLVDNFSLEDIAEIKQIYYMVCDKLIDQRKFMEELNIQLKKMDFRVNLPKETIYSLFEGIQGPSG